MKMKLLQYRVLDFKSIKDSGWIECDEVTTLVGVNESGKSNLLLALWKLNPAEGGAIRFSDDMPVKALSDFRAMDKKPIFIVADFDIIDPAILDEIASICKCNPKDVSIVRISKDYDCQTFIEFPNYCEFKGYAAKEIKDLLENTHAEIEKAKEFAGEKGIKDTALEKCSDAMELIDDHDFIDKALIESIINILESVSASGLKTSVIQAVLNGTLEELSEKEAKFDLPLLKDNERVKSIILSSMPKFVYYSNYGNLDSEIYLPHVIDNMSRDDLSSTAEAKARTLKVLFEYVKLSPEEILEMGDVDRVRETEAQIALGAEKTKEREILLQSASAKLTREFKEWWKQGEYSFDLRADGRFFRIWVSDAQRPERIVLENRSTGLQWFLSFYLVFLVESKESHSNSILLLDEAGMSLHPLAQKDLTAFFDNLARTNQIIHTTHSPFLVDTNNIDRVKVVYIDSNGYTVVSSDLRAAENVQRSKSVYAVHAALGLSVSDVLLQGCRPVIVEGPSDQYYFNAIKQFLIGNGTIQPTEEIVFLPSGGVKGISQLASLVSSKSGLPFVIVDSDASGKQYYDKLTKELYTGSEKEKIIEIGSLTKIENAETEDIIPISGIERSLERLLRNDDEDDFRDEYDSTTAIIPQIESFAQRHGIVLETGYKVEMAKAFKKLLSKKTGFIEESVVNVWSELFSRIMR